MEREEATIILMNLINELERINQGSTAIRAENVNGLIVEDNVFSGFGTALDAPNSKNVTFKRNLVNNSSLRSELLNLIKQFLSESTQLESKYNKAAHVRIKDQILQRWPEIVGTGVAVAFMSLIRS